MDERLKKLTWKYFWQQKWAEIKDPLKIISSMFGLVGFGMLMTGVIEDVNFLILIGLCMMVPGALIIIFLIINWIKSNWEKATERAEKELGAETLEFKDVEDLLKEDYMRLDLLE